MKYLYPVATILSLLFSGISHAEIFDLVINNGRVMDPETNFDAVRNVGIKNNRIAAITKKAIKGKKSIDASGLVIAPGFIDTHIHGQDPFAVKMALRDGTTTGLDLEAGAININQWYQQKANHWQINYGISASHLFARMSVMDSELDLSGPIDVTHATALVKQSQADGVQGWAQTPSNTEQLNQISQRIDEELRQGALGLGSALSYMANAVSSYEMFELQRTTSRYQRPTAVHTRYHMNPTPYNGAAIAFDEIYANASLLKAPMLVVHNNDHGWEEIEEKLQLAREQGLNMWSEHYPYTAGSTIVGARFFTPEIWVEKFGHKYEDTLYAPKTDRFLDEKAYQYLVKTDPGQAIIAFSPERKKWLLNWLSMPHMTVASDGVPGVGVDGKLLDWDAPYSAYAGHPRSSGSRAKTLRLARENKIPLMHSLAQLSYWSAKHLGDAGLKSMQERGRMQEGMIADITIFDPENVQENSSYKMGEHGLPSSGIPWVIVNGQIVVEQSKVLPSIYPGQAIRYAVEKAPRFVPLSAKKWLKDHRIFSPTNDQESSVSHLN